MKDVINEADRHDLAYAWQLAVKLAEWHGMIAGIVDYNPEEVLFAICLPSGCFTFSVPTKYVTGKWKSVQMENVKAEQGWSDTIEDCLNGMLVHKRILMIPEDEEETE